MIDIKDLVKQPIFFERNRVYRIYKGGKPYKELFNDGFDDGTDNKVTVTSGSHNTYEVLIWLNEAASQEELDDPDNMTAGNQDHEQGLTYTGTVEIAVSGATDKITGE